MGITAKDVQGIAFSRPPLGKRGYNQQQVDALLDQVETELTARESGTGARVSGAFVREARFSTPPIGRRGYNEDEVDRFLGLVAAELDGSTPSASSPSVADAETILYVSPSTRQRIIDMVKAESELLAQWPSAVEAHRQPPSLTVYTVR